MQSGSVVAIVPTYNEPDELRRVVESLVSQGVDGLHLLVVNAGDPLPESIASLVEEVRVDPECYWTHCINKGFEIVRGRAYGFVYLTNADTYALPGTLAALLEHASSDEKSIACAPAYIESQEGVRLLYSHQDPMGFLLYGRLIRPWADRTDQSDRPFEIVLTGGQGVMFSAKVLEEHGMDEVNFPHYASDHDFWLTLRKDGYRLTLLPQTGVVNTRVLSAQHATGFGAKMKALRRRMTSDKTPESWRIMWRLRRKHLPWPVAVLSTVVSFGLRWTVGFPKILRRT
ncbi:MAG: glycosyltransferase family 2 protein [Armatimonadetes bacterium]|nr:glycosyltransferase family 2 protein [Armatimonadota bacterium]